MIAVGIPRFFLLASFTLVAGCNGGSGGDTQPVTDNTPTSQECVEPTVLCVDDTAGSNQEYSTIQAAVNVVRPGDAILVHDGTYRGFSISAYGTSTIRILIKAQGNSTVINQPNSNGEGITLSNADYITIEGFTIANMPSYALASHNPTPTYPMHGLIIRNNTVRNSGAGSAGNWPNIYMSEVADSLIENNVASGSVQSHGIYLANGGSDNTVLRGNRCFGNAKNGIHFTVTSASAATVCTLA